MAAAAITEAQANAAKEKALTQATQVQKQTKPEVPLESDAEKAAPAVAADMHGGADGNDAKHAARQCHTHVNHASTVASTAL
jgi:hypothetical protein